MSETQTLADDVAAVLGSDLWSLVCSVSAELREVSPIVGDSYPGYRPTAFRLRFADGRVLKGKRLETAAQAEEVAYISRCLEGRGLPRVLARCGTALLSEWIEGRSLSAMACDARLLRRCGALQGALHGRPLPADHPSPPHAAIVPRRGDAGRFAELAHLGILDGRLADDAAEVAMRYAPHRCAWGFTYNDFCPDNIVVRTFGDVCVVDTETLSVQPYEYDLGRTWYRWPMARKDRREYFNGYHEHRQLTDFHCHFPYWGIAAIVDSALFRGRRGGVAATAVPVRRLRQLLCVLDDGVLAEDAVFLC